MTIFDQSEIDDLLASAAIHGADSIGADEAQAASAAAQRRQQPLPAELSRIFKVKVPIIVRLSDRAMSLGEILHLAPGSIVEFDTPCDADLSLVVGNQTIGSGQAVKVGENFGIRITRLSTMSDRIRAMGDG